MKLSVKLAGLCASATFIVAGFPGMFQRLLPMNSDAMEAVSGMDLLEPLVYSIGGTIIAGFIGFQIGHILSHPTGRSQKKNVRKTPPPLPSAQVPGATASEDDDQAAMAIRIDDEELLPAATPPTDSSPPE